MTLVRSDNDEEFTTMKDWLKTVTLGSAMSVSLLFPIAGTHAQDSELQEIAQELTQDPHNPILLMQQQMLSHKAGDGSATGQGRVWMPRQTNLRRELSGSTPPRRQRGTFGNSLDVLTGQRAIDESLQLGSIGVNRTRDDQSDRISVDEIAPVEIASHPWAEMIEGRDVTVPEIAKLVPADTLFVHMIRPVQFLELEDILQQQSDLFGDVYDLGSASSLKGKMMQRLGIPDADAFIAAVDEMAFVSDDLSFLPRTDYALVLKLVNAFAEKGFEVIVDDDAIYRKVGDYLVVATHPELIDRIEGAQRNQSDAMSSALDYHYALLEMEPQRDGLIYLSEAFIRKLTGPAYRINSRRRNTILDALETLQYSVFAYRRLSGEWPASLQAIADANYINDGTVYAPEHYSIDEDGRVAHSTWGTVWQVTPVGRVPLDGISAAEKRDYEQFSAGYQSFFREFFDPIAIAYTISDQLYLHTIILPLIDNSEYRWLQSFFSGEHDALSFLFDADRLGAVNIAAAFSVDDLLVRAWSGRSRPGDESETDDARRERMIFEAENEIADEMFGEPLAEGERLLDFIGDEVFLGIGEENSFSLSNIADIDVWFGIKLRDRERAEAFFRRLWQRIAGEFGNRGGGLLQLSSTEPLSNEYNGQQYYLLPTGFVNVYYVFFDDAFYVTVSQVAMNRLIDARNDDTDNEFSENLQRGFAHIGTTHNIVAAMDLEKVASFGIGQELNAWGQLVAAQFAAQRDALQEAMTLAKILPDYDGTLANVAEYYRELPSAFYGAQFEADAGVLYLAIDQQRKPFSELPRDRRGRALTPLLRSTVSADELRKRLQEFRAATLGMSFTAEGLEVKLSIGNPNVVSADSRFTFDEPGDRPGAARISMGVIAVGAAIVLLLLGIVTLMRKRDQSL